MRTTLLAFVLCFVVATSASAQSARDYEMVVCDTVEQAKRFITLSRGLKVVGRGVYGYGCELRIIKTWTRKKEAHPFWLGTLFFKIAAVRLLAAYDGEPLPQGTVYTILQTIEELIA